MTLEHIVNCHEPSSKVFIFGQQSISRVQVYLAKLQQSSLGSQAIWRLSFSEVLSSFVAVSFKCSPWHSLFSLTDLIGF